MSLLGDLTHRQILWKFFSVENFLLFSRKFLLLPVSRSVAKSLLLTIVSKAKNLANTIEVGTTFHPSIIDFHWKPSRFSRAQDRWLTPPEKPVGPRIPQGLTRARLFKTKAQQSGSFFIGIPIVNWAGKTKFFCYRLY